MASDGISLGVFTTDERLIVRTWDDWMARATGIGSAQALDRPLAEVLPEVSARGLLGAFESVLSRGTVEVLASALHHYLFSCPPSTPSAVFDRMQQRVTIGPLREDSRIVGTIVTVEDVTARVEHERELAERLAKAPSAESLTRLLDQEDWRARRVAVAALVQQGQAVVDALVRTLREQHGNFNVLSSALDLLAVSDIDVVEPLIGFLDDRDQNLRIQAALILGDRRDSRAVPALIAHLEDADVNVQFHAIEALGRLGATEAVEALTAIAERRDFFLSFPAVQALSRVGTATVAPRLVPLLADELLRAPVIEALGELGDEDVTEPLVRLLNTADAPTDVITDALAGLYDRYEARYGAGDHIADLVRRSITATGTQNILDAIDRVGADRLPGLAKVLGWLEGEAVQRALTRLLGRQKVRSQVVEALVRYGAGVVTLLVEQLQAEDLETRQAAAVALGRIGDRRATGPLVAALADRELAVPAAGALARIGDRNAFDALIARLGDPDSSVRQAVIAALNSIGHPDMPASIVPLLRDTSPIVRESAVRIAGYFGYPECLDMVLACCRDEVEAVRRIAVEHLALFDDPRVFDTLAESMDRDAPAVRAAAAAAIVRTDHPSRVAALLRGLQDQDPWVRYAVLRSLGALGDAAALPAIVSTLQHDATPQVRLAAIDAIGRLKPGHALHILEPLTEVANEDIARAAIAALGHVDRTEALAVLERFLRSPEPWRRLAAIDAVALRREPRVPEILQWVAAADQDRAIVTAAVDALTSVGARDDHQGTATRALIALTAEPALREAAVAALSRLPARRIPDVASGLHHAVADVRRATVEALSRMKQPEASRLLESALDDVAATVRLAAVAELKHLGSRTSRRKLMALARTDSDAQVRHAAMLAVARTEAAGDNRVAGSR